ncbi:hypothetical protein TNCV_2761191 [Trichonephila clavipes]|nr:hypothetical protein TNCV_2761191 [Trichonephila clavipes]
MKGRAWSVLSELCITRRVDDYCSVEEADEKVFPFYSTFRRFHITRSKHNGTNTEQRQHTTRRSRLATCLHLRAEKNGLFRGLIFVFSGTSHDSGAGWMEFQHSLVGG